MDFRWTSSVLGIVFAGAIIWLVRRDHMRARHASWWLVVAVGFVILGFFPKLLDPLALRLGVTYPPTLFFTAAFGLAIIWAVLADLERSEQERRTRRLFQRLALVESLLAQQGIEVPAVVDDAGDGPAKLSSGSSDAPESGSAGLG